MILFKQLWDDSFVTNKYTMWYSKIIESAFLRDDQHNYMERHHIIPKSITANNFIVKLTAREHFICHWLLTKMVKNNLHRKSMAHALMKMCSGNKHQAKRYVVPSRVYDLARRSLSESRKGVPLTDETKRKISMSKKKLFETRDGTFKGKKHSQECKDKSSQRMSGENHPFYGTKRPEHAKIIGDIFRGVPKSEAHKQKISMGWQESRERIECQHCNKITTKAMHTRWHGINCKEIGR